MSYPRYAKIMNHTDPRLYILTDNMPFQKGAEISLSPQQAHYIGNVMRRKPGQNLRVFDGVNGEWLAKIEFVKRSQAVISLSHSLRPQLKTQGLELIFSLLKRDATELVIRMGTELGVTCFRPVISARTNNHKINSDRLMLIAQEASEQCERLDIPNIRPLEPLADLLVHWPSEKNLAVALERQSCEPVVKNIAGLIIGPEGGFSPQEIDSFNKHKAIKGFSLGPRILRAETAVCAGLSILNTQYSSCAL
ncbi:16S rRNA (uracil(1498)-N(3))-methyltransferase [Aristophania vespae]|uniref:Ribosomal RNA small subunit methyltransferase E n=1 Tax=Aristophania vespae TaxID=2697033 RepID=A0A6P1NDX1_9PROT|nr:16S rRNA (uracil(1498)-N(3))-methyltransferase [Aristophania vespae]QHI95643.1 16S rRNA (uracil(1498)-N(3))-methyltransferase [Aristophania vespae]